MVHYSFLTHYIPRSVKIFLKRLIRHTDQGQPNQTLSQMPPNFDECYVDWQIHTCTGGRGIEVPWVLRKIRDVQGYRILDIGCVNFNPPWSRVCTERYLSDLNNFLVTIDQRMPFYAAKHYHFSQGDANRLPFQKDVFDLVLCISVLEHAGLLVYGRQKVDNDADRDIFIEMIRVLRPEGRLLITLPFGVEMIYEGWIRSYTRSRLDSLIDHATTTGHSVIEEDASYFLNTVQGWIHSSAEELKKVRQYDGMGDICGLYCGVFKKQ